MTDQRLVQVRDSFKALQLLQAEQKFTIAKMIRQCIMQSEIDTRNHRLRGHETSAERSRIIAENTRLKRCATLHLLQLATMLEDEVTDYLSKETTDVHGNSIAPQRVTG